MKESSQSRISLQDPVTRNPSDVIAGTNVVWTSGAAWHNVIAEAYSFEHIDTPEFQTIDHSVVLHLSAPAFIELKTDGQGDTRQRAPGDLSIFPAATVCQVRSREAHEVLVVNLPQQLVAQSGLELGLREPFRPQLCAYLRDAQLEHICRALKAEAESGYLSGSLYGDSLAMAFSVHLLRQYSGASLPLVCKGGIAPQALRRVIDHIESNLDSPLRMASLAGIAGLSQYRFAHNFRSAIGVPPHQYVLRTRLARAKRLLRETNLSILEIAYSVGCQSSSRFNSLFRRETGTIPSAYRASFH